MVTTARGVNVQRHPNADYSGVGLGKFAADPLINYFDAAECLFDFGSDLGWPVQRAPVMSDSIPNIGSGAVGAFTITGTAPTLAGGGIDFSTCTQAPNIMEFPGVAAGIQATVAEEWLLLLYMKLPVDGDWPDAPASRTLLGFGNSATGVDLGEFYIVNSSGTKNLALRRGLASASSEVLAITPGAGSKGAVVQLAGWRKSGKTNFRLRSGAEIIMPTALTSADNPGDFGGLSMKLGLINSGVARVWNASLNSYELRTRNMRYYRGGLINLANVSANVIAGLDADWVRVAARNVFN